MNDPTELAVEKFPSSLIYARELVKKKWFPGIDSNGRLHLSQGVGSESVNNRKFFDSDEDGLILSDHLEMHFPNDHIHVVSSPVQRALKHRAQNTQPGLDGTPIPPWNAGSAQKAELEFEVPRDTRIIIFWPDLFQRHVLSSIERFKTQKGGVLTPCPHCKSNQHVSDKCAWSQQLAWPKTPPQFR